MSMCVEVVCRNSQDGLIPVVPTLHKRSCRHIKIGISSSVMMSAETLEEVGIRSKSYRPSVQDRMVCAGSRLTWACVQYSIHLIESARETGKS
jgi:hypothetical protein